MKGFINLTHTNNAKFNSKLDKKPNGNTDLINEVTGKINQEYVPTGIAKGLIFAGTFNENGIISASAYAPETQGLNIKDINVSTIVGYEFQYVGEKEYTLGTLKVNKNDIIVCNGAEEPNWTLIDNSDKVVSVNGQTGAVTIDFEEISGSVKIDKSSIVKNESGELEAVALKNKVLYKENNNIVEANFNGYVELTDSEYETLESTGSVVLSDGRTLTFDKGTIYVTPLADAISKLIFEKTGSVLKSKQSFDTHVQIMIEFETQGMHYGADFVLHPYDAAICIVSYNFVGHTGTAYLDEYGYVNVNIPDNLSFTDIKGHYMELGG